MQIYNLTAHELQVTSADEGCSSRRLVIAGSRQGFSSEATVLISCSLNVIMVMITQMTPGLWGITHLHTGARTGDAIPPARTRDCQTEPVLVARPTLFGTCRPRMGRVNEQIKFPAATKELKGHEKEMDIFCCLTLNAVFQSNYLSLLQPLLVHGIVTSQNSKSEPEQECGGLSAW